MIINWWNVRKATLKDRRTKNNLVFFQNEDIVVQWDELDELDKITHAWIGFNYSLSQEQKTF